MIKIDYKEFNENLLLTQLYCEEQLKSDEGNVATIFRSINPEYNGMPFFSFKFSSYFETIWQITPWPTENEFIHNELFQNQLTIKKETVLILDNEINFEGRILIAGIDETIADGASEEISEGFIDSYDCPPIDTWFYMSNNNNGRVIFAWIPDKFVNLVNLGMDVNPVDCFYWYDKDSSEVYDWDGRYVSEVRHERKLKRIKDNLFLKLKRFFG